MILAKSELLKKIKEGKIAITPFSPDAVGACSVDLSLSQNFRRFKPGSPVRLTAGVDYLSHTVAVTASTAKPLKIRPHEIVLGSTQERITLSDCYCGWIQGRSRTARLGLSVHVSSSLIQPGVDNVQVLEIVNNAPFPILLIPGIRVCQVVFEELTGKGSYSGRFANQTKP